MGNGDYGIVQVGDTIKCRRKVPNAGNKRLEDMVANGPRLGGDEECEAHDAGTAPIAVKE